MNISDHINKNKIAIVIVGYNRLKSITRLLGSLVKAKYPPKDIPLVISIDCSGDEELYTYLRNFEWPYGKKYIDIKKERLGLKNHIFQCGDLTKYFKAIILLEDDLFVSEFFYTYVEQTVEKYGHDDRIAEISLYKNETNGYVGLPFDNMQTNSDVFLMQDVSTWGECWTEYMWNQFKDWLSHTDEPTIQALDMPDAIKKWTRAWSKYYNAYVVSNHKFVLYPNVSLTTNFSDAGEHGKGNSNIVQVNLQQSNLDLKLPNYEDLIRYDIYCNNEAIYSWLGIPSNEVCLDIYGIREYTLNKHYILSPKILSFKKVKSFALSMRPIELNIKENILGSGIFLYNSTIYVKHKKISYSKDFVPYFLQGFNIFLLRKYIFKNIGKSIKRKLHLCGD